MCLARVIEQQPCRAELASASAIPLINERIGTQRSVAEITSEK